MDDRLTGALGQPFEDGLSAHALFSIIRRHWVVVLAFTLSMGAAGAVVGLGLPAWFKAEGVLVIPAVPQRIAELQELPDASPDVNTVQSEVDILQSRAVIEPVVRSLKLWKAPEYQETEYPYGWSWQRVEARLGETWQDLRGIRANPKDSFRSQPVVGAEPGPGLVPSQAQIDGLVGTYTGYLAVSNDGHSMTLHVSYSALTPERAAAVANAQLDSYRNFEVETKVAAAEHANSALRSQVAELQRQLLIADAAVARYRAEHGLAGEIGRAHV